MSDNTNGEIVRHGAKTGTFRYDGDGRLVLMDVGGVVTAVAGEHYQNSAGVGTKHYFANGVRIAQRVGGTPYYLLTDHLGSTAVTTDQTGAYVTDLRYYPFGRPRYNPGGQTTDYRFTSQRWQGDIGPYYYGARWYDHLIGRFTQADTIVPEKGRSRDEAIRILREKAWLGTECLPSSAASQSAVRSR